MPGSTAPRRARRAAVARAAWCVAALLPLAARAEMAVVEIPPPAAPAPRPRITVAAGMGVSLDSSGFMPAENHALPAFVATGGFGDGQVGFDLGVFSTAASGRYRTAAPVDRLSLDAMAVFRPFAASLPAGVINYAARVSRTVGVELGLGFERDSQVVRSGSRFGVHLGGRLELPLEPAGRPSELRLRLALRQLFGLHTPQVGDTTVGDSFELYAAVVTSF